MNLISQAYGGIITWAEAEARIIAAEAAVVGRGILARDVSDVKQFVSDAIGQADSAVASNYANVAKAAETALEAELALLTRGMSVPLNPLMSKGIDDLVGASVKAAHAWALAAKAALAVPSQQAAQSMGNVGVVANAPNLSAQLNKDSRD